MCTSVSPAGRGFVVVDPYTDWIREGADQRRPGRITRSSGLAARAAGADDVTGQPPDRRIVRESRGPTWRAVVLGDEPARLVPPGDASVGRRSGLVAGVGDGVGCPVWHDRDSSACRGESPTGRTTTAA